MLWRRLNFTTKIKILRYCGNLQYVFIQGSVLKDYREFFDPRRKPWIEMEQATTEEIIEQVRKCPSGALSFSFNDQVDDIGNDG